MTVMAFSKVDGFYIKYFASEFNSLLIRYIDILNSMPEDYGQTLHILQNYISVDQISNILDCPDHVISNRMILDCLVEKLLHCKNDLLSLCHQLSRINSSALLLLINEIRKGIACTNNTYSKKQFYFL